LRCKAFRVSASLFFFSLAMTLPELPPQWRDDVVHMLFDFLEDAGLAQTLHALEQETGCGVAAQHSTPSCCFFFVQQQTAPSPSPFSFSSTQHLYLLHSHTHPHPSHRHTLTPHHTHPHRCRLQGSAEHLGEELRFLHTLVLSGDWEAAEEFIAPTEGRVAVTLTPGGVRLVTWTMPAVVSSCTCFGCHSGGCQIVYYILLWTSEGWRLSSILNRVLTAW
jgi:hypothetical protein